ncbi:hypothetical protein GCM10010193_25710 [Kitasatospora atroaurantiaca]|uniref:Uncharacterized protein n=1 Tax=Kitasatospora atroaurantiaca TaxID=285545 RepID=A0A561F0H5_9ACTN|nr:hypothetical protein [Kitasatospora atroaurantiaca]TWE21364.1 hypothetical protein FB465_6544 [Kitasatospora atroaurantiaca]
MNTATVLWTLLAILSLVWVPAAVLMAAGRVPRGWGWLEPVRRRGIGLLLLYGNIPLNTIPRALHTSEAVVLLGIAAGCLCALGGIFLLIYPGPLPAPGERR